MCEASDTFYKKNNITILSDTNNAQTTLTVNRPNLTLT